VLKIPAGDVQPSTAVFQESGQNCVTGLGKFRGRLIVLLDMARLLEFSTVQPKADSVADKSSTNAAESWTAAGQAQAASAGGRKL
jgi:hypothetical protein